MLSGRFAQPPRRYEPRDSAGAETACGRCKTDVFNEPLRDALVAAAKDRSPLSWRYSCTAGDVYASMLAGCRWCASIGNAVLTTADLRYWEDRWFGSASDGDSMLRDDVDEDVGPDEDVVGPEEQGAPAEDDAVNKSEISDSETPGFLTINALDCSAPLEVTIDFLRWGDSPVFNLLDVAVEATDATTNANMDTTDEEDGVFSWMTGEETVRMRFEVMSPDMHEDVFPKAWDILSADSDGWATRARAWLQSCRAHTGCEPTGGFQPTRLIDLRDSDHPRLVTRDVAAPPHPYACLSYVWGPSQSYVLTMRTLTQMHTTLDISMLPKTITDAMTVARRMGFQYIWIDALCIIQDSPDDKLNELPKMADIYRESSLTIVAASASSASEGFLRASEPATFFVEPFSISFGARDDHPASLVLGYRQSYKAGTDPVNSRAWTLQERVLSPRLLIFSRSGVMWMCRESHVNPGAAPGAGPPYQTSLGSGAGVEEMDETKLRERWMAVRADYTEMELSYYSDKLPAISALAADVARRGGWTYLAGLWKENLFSELHWRSMKRTPSGEAFRLKPQKVREAGYLAPSWSWASTGLGVIADSEDERSDRDAFHFNILDCRVDTAGNANFQFGPVKGGFLLVEGSMVELPWRLEDRPEWDGSDVALLDADKDEEGRTLVVGDGTLDPLDDDIRPDTNLGCLATSRLRLGRQRIVPIEGLLVLPIGSGGAFRRVGYFRMTAPSVFENASARILRIE